MINMELAIERQEDYVEQLRMRRDWATQQCDRAGFVEAKVLFEGAQDTLMRMYEDKLNMGDSYL